MDLPRIKTGHKDKVGFPFMTYAAISVQDTLRVLNYVGLRMYVRVLI